MQSVLDLFQRLFGRDTDANAVLQPLPDLSKPEQFALLRAELRDSQDPHRLGELVLKHFGGRVNEAYRLFTISKAEYLAWAESLTLSAFVNTEPSPRDDFFLLQRGSGWVLVAQERGQTNWELPFATQEQALRHVYRKLSPYGIFPHLHGDA